MISEGFINSGKFGVVFRAKYNSIDVAAKSIPNDFNWKTMESFENEIKACQDLLEHPNIVKVYGVVVSNTFKKGTTK